MNALKLYHDLKARDVILEARGEQLRVDAPAGVLTEADRDVLKEFKPRLLKFLSRPSEESQAAPERESVASWAGPALVKIRDPFTQEWHEWPAAECLPGVIAEADRRRKGDLWK
jgi:hypothetical protein